MTDPQYRIVVVGAGVTGLTTALLLSRNPACSITIAAKHMPGDYDIEYASPWAGANYCPVSVAGTRQANWERNTWPELSRLASDVPEAAVHFQENRNYVRAKDADTPIGQWQQELQNPSPWFKDTVPDFRPLPASSLGSYDFGTAFTTVCINTAIYLPYLASQCLAAGVKLKRAAFAHLSDAATAHVSGQPAHLLVNCTGLGARKLGGVEDANVVPARGQTVLVRNESPGIGADSSGTDDGEEELAYVIQRAAGGGTILGGSYQKGNYEPAVDLELSSRIMTRAVALVPELTGGLGPEHLDVVRHNVGLRPLRLGGTRVEKEVLKDVGREAEEGKGLWVVHSYGHGGYGYQCSYGCAQEVVGLVEGALGIEKNGAASR